jgi:radical SAM superfamily enzyme YgiQ (UPF0313 family)
MSYKLALVSPPLRATSRKLPISLLQLAGYTDKYVKGAETFIVDIKRKPYFRLTKNEFKEIKKQIVEEIAAKKPQMVGFTILFSDVLDSIELAQEVRKRLPDAVIIAGGVHASYRPDELLYEGSVFDYVVIGEGERTLKELVEAHIKSKENKIGLKEIKKIRGLAYMNKENKIIETGFRELIQDLDEVPMIPYEKIDTEFYFKPDLTQIYYFLFSSSFLMTTRGCPSRCTFCTGNDLWKKTCGSYAIRSCSVERTLDELEILVNKYKVDGIFISDQSFTYNRERAKKICEGIIKRGLKFIWQAQTKAFMVDDELVGLMKKAGCIQLCFGFESGSQEALNRMKKGITIEQIKNATRICQKHGMRLFPCFMINTPGETFEELQKTRELIDWVDGPKTYYNFAVCIPFPGSQIYDELGKKKFEKNEYADLTDTTDDYIRKEKRIKMCKHNVDLVDEITRLNKKYNPIRKRIFMHLDPIYLKQILRSKRKLQYIKEGLEIIKFILHKVFTGERAAG